MQIYCLINHGSSLPEKIADYLLQQAHLTMDRKDRKNRLVMYNEGLTSEITTEYKIGFMGTIAGIIFHANFDWQEGSTKTDFIVRPIKNRDELLGGKWIRAPFFEEELHSDPVLN